MIIILTINYFIKYKKNFNEFMRPKGDNVPILPVTDQSMEEEEYQYPLMTVTSNVFSNRKYNLIETA